MISFLDEACVYEGAVGPEPGHIAVGREAVRQTLAEPFVAEAREILVATPFVCQVRGMLEWTAFQPLPNGHLQLLRGCDRFEFHGNQIRRISGFRKVGHEANRLLEKSALLAQIWASYDRFQARLAPLSEAQLITEGAIGLWTIKDVLAHLTAWHELGRRNIKR